MVCGISWFGSRGGSTTRDMPKVIDTCLCDSHEFLRACEVFQSQLSLYFSSLHVAICALACFA